MFASFVLHLSTYIIIHIAARRAYTQVLISLEDNVFICENIIYVYSVYIRLLSNIVGKEKHVVIVLEKLDE